ncbi:MAG: methyl-accepting chemotaxis protein [Candidatus Eisenbacteria bacterium]|uniref:Methyl-accepting chemotaxis protein n=1 Tax=Eiseniibacteriota bacterium TaxID=2212470 RepID=A0A933SA17_UNCEI|nr:methyl-accepting chemotaxis protein [Candidatus Eisenbacteria bacterium]
MPHFTPWSPQYWLALARRSIANRLTLLLVLTATFVLGVLATALSLHLRSEARTAAYEELESTARRIAADVQPSFDLPFQSARSLADAVVILHHGSPSRAMAESLVARAVAGSPGMLGAWVEFDRNAFDGADAAHAGARSADGSGRFLPWYVRREGRIRLQPTPADYESGDFYWLPRKSEREMLMEPYKDFVDRDSVLMTSVCVPFWDRGKFVGVAGADLALADVQKTLGEHHPMRTGWLSLVSREGAWVGHPDAARLGQHAGELGSLDEAWSALRRGDSYRTIQRDPRTHAEVLRTFVPFRAGHGGDVWAMVVTVPTATVFAHARRTTAFVVIGILLALVPIAVVARLATRRVTRPLAQGVGVLERVAAGDLTQKAAVDGEDEVARFAHALNSAVHHTREAMREANDAGRAMAGAAHEFAGASETLTRHSQSQAAGVAEASAQLRELGQTTARNAEDAQAASRATAEARGAAEGGGRVVHDAVAAMEEVERQSRRIADIVGVIDEIAFRTNLLALNASVEAARAGENGRGFAVVAQEVRSLAGRSADSAREIHALILETGQRVESSAALVRRSGETLGTIVESVRQASRLSDAIAEASRRQAEQLTGIQGAVDGMDGEVRAMAEEAERLAEAARGTAATGERLMTAVARFSV